MAGASKKHRFIYVQIAVVAAAAVVLMVLVEFGPLERAERWILQAFYDVRGPAPISSHVVIAAIDEESIDALGPWPWPAKVFANIFGRLRDGGVKTIGVDTTFADDDFANDRHLLELIEQERDVVIGFSMYRTKEEIPLKERAWATGEDSFDILTSQMVASTVIPDSSLPSMGGVKTLPRALRLMSGTLGFANLFPPEEGPLLRVPVVVRYRNLLLPSFALAVASRAVDFTPLLRKDAHGRLVGVSIGERQIPLDPSGEMLMNFAGPSGAYERISVARILGDDDLGDVLKDTIVLLGPTFEGPTNFVDTPFGKHVPSIEVWANAVDTLLNGRPLTSVVTSQVATVGIIIILTLMLGYVLPRVSILFSMLIALGLGAAVGIDGYLFFSRAGLWFAVAAPLIAVALIWMAITLYRFVTEERVKRRIAIRYGGSLGRRALRELAEGSSSMARRDERHQLTVLRIGIRSFPRLCDELKTDQLIEFMRSYFKAVAQPLAEEDAYIWRAGNDGMIAIFGAPAARADHASRACRAALAARAVVAAKRAGWQQRYGMGQLRLSIGMHTAPTAVGEIVMLGRREFAAVGDALPMSEMLAKLGRTYKTSVIASAETVQATREWFVYRPLDFVRMPDMKRSVEIYELMGKRGLVTPYIEIYLRAYDAFRDGRYDDALRLAEEVLAKLPHDGPSKLMRNRAKKFKERPPKDSWDGVWVIH